MARSIKTASALTELAQAHGSVYIRWSRSIAADRRRGYSIDHSSGQAEGGLSVQEIAYTEDCIEGTPGWLACLVADYSYLAINGARCYVLAGERSGTGADNEPVIDAESMTVLGTIPPRVWRPLTTYAVDTEDRRMNHKGYNDDRPWPEVPEEWTR